MEAKSINGSWQRAKHGNGITMGNQQERKGVLQFSDRLHSTECVPCWRELKVSDGKCNDQGVGEKTFAQKILSLEDKVIS